MTQGRYFKQGLTGLNSEFSRLVALIIYQVIAGGRIIGFIPFPWV